MTSKNQQDVVKHFKKGVCHLLIATSVAEEGLDIKACNCVFRYNYTTNEIGRVQSKGTFIRYQRLNKSCIILPSFPKQQNTRCLTAFASRDVLVSVNFGCFAASRCESFHCHAVRTTNQARMSWLNKWSRMQHTPGSVFTKTCLYIFSNFL